MSIKKSLSKSLNQSQDLLGWFLIALFFCYQYILRVTPGVLSSDLRDAFMLNAEDFSALGAYYLYAYALMQMPLGFIISRIGVKRTVLISLFLCIIGTLWLTQSTSIMETKLSRILVGAGSGCAFMSALKWASDHFHESKRAFLIGATLAMGTMGALSAAHPLVYAVDHYGWKNAVIFSGFLGIGLFIIILIFLKDAPSPKAPSSPKPAPALNAQKKTAASFAQSGHASADKAISPTHDFLLTLKSIVTNKTTLIYSFLTVGVYTPLAVLADLWGVSFVMEKFELSRSDSASTTMLMYVGLAIGCLFLPTLAQRYRLMARSIQFCSAGLLIIFLVILGLPWIPTYALSTMFFTIGILCGSEMICFTGVLSKSTPKTSGLIIGFVNTLNMSGGAILQQIIGRSLDAQWDGSLSASGIRLYNGDQYTLALCVLPLVLCMCLILSFFLKQSDFGTHKVSH